MYPIVQEAAIFSRMPIRPSWVAMEAPEAPSERHVAFLEGLLRDIDKRPAQTVSAQATGAVGIPTALPTIFLSHAGIDAILAAYIETIVRECVKNHDVFRTTRSGQIPSGIPWFQHITGHLSSASKYLVLLTPQSHKRPWVNFETGAAFFSGRKLVPVIGGGLAASDVIEPLKSLQLHSLEIEADAVHIFSELGGELVDPTAFVNECRRLGAASTASADASQGWKFVEVEGKRYAWDGPIDEMLEGAGVPLIDAIVHALTKAEMSSLTMPGTSTLKAIGAGYRQVFHVDSRSVKHAVVSKDEQLLFAKPV